ncbi:MAG: APC family permease [Xanthomonadales bacterium]|nr:APC family permease [Xanthomonadales bacterium]
MKNEQLLERQIGPLGFSAITLNGLIGGGIFALPAAAAAAAGAFSPWLFLICLALFVSVILAFARAASLTAETGGPISYATIAFGPFAGFQAGWLLYLGRLASTAANTNLLVTYAAWFLPALDQGVVRMIAIVAVLGALTWVNMVGVRQGMVTIFALTLCKLLPLSAVALLGLGHVSAAELLGAEIPELGSLGQTILLLIYAYIGFEGAVVPAGEGRDPQRDLPRALIFTLLGTGVFYFLIQLSSYAVHPDIAASQRPLADVAEVLLGSIGALLLSLGAIFSIGGNLSAMMLSVPRMTYALARDGSLPGWFGTVHPRWHTPANSILFIGVLSTILAVTGSFLWLAAMATLARMLVYIVSIAAIPGLARANPARRGFELPGGMLIPGVAILICGWLAAQADLKGWLLAAAFFVLGSGLYLFTRRPISSV